MNFLCCALVIVLCSLHCSYAINENCTQDDDCSVKEKTSCIENKCQCDKVSVWKENSTKCLSYATEYKTLCYEDWQCTDFLGEDSECNNNACLCKEGYRWYKGKCQIYASKGDNCSEEVICLDGNDPLALNCSQNICQCSDGYYDRGEDCRSKSEEDKECALTGDCFPKENKFGIQTYSHCELGKCIKNSIDEKPKLKEFNNFFTYTRQSSYLKFLMDVQTETTTQINPTKCPNGVSSNLTKEECSECPNTIYFRDVTCICDRGFFLQDSQCIAELGVENPYVYYESDAECPIKPGKAVDGVCYCRNYWFQDSTNQECEKTTLQYTRNCLDNDWCKAMGPYAYCNSETQKCNCSSQAVLNETSFYCELKPNANISEICLGDSACPLYETCIDEQCQCDDGFFRVNESTSCLPKIGYSCEVRDCSHIDNAMCGKSDLCQCENESFVSNGYVCLEAVSNLTDGCQIPQQCVNIPHSECRKVSDAVNASSQCLCTDDFLDVDGYCYARKAPGSQCTTSFNCTVILGDSFECRNNLCQCPMGTSLTTDNKCASSANTIIFSPLIPLVITTITFLLPWF